MSDGIIRDESGQPVTLTAEQVAAAYQWADDFMAGHMRQPGQVPPGHPDAGKPVPWGEHPRDCDCRECP